MAQLDKKDKVLVIFDGVVIASGVVVDKNESAQLGNGYAVEVFTDFNQYRVFSSDVLVKDIR
jgi:hypothetical protein